MANGSSLRTAIVAAVALTLLSGVGGSASASTSSAPALTPAVAACSAEAYAYPERWQAEGATFLGRVVSSRKVELGRLVRFAVQRVFAGDIGGAVTVRTHCVETRFQVGERYLVSSALYGPTSGTIENIRFVSAASVAWHVADDGSIRLVRYGPAERLGGPARPYLTGPDTVYEAAHAVAYGVQNKGVCTGGPDHVKATWHIEADRIHGRLQFVIAIDGHRERTWTVAKFQNGTLVHRRGGLLAQPDLDLVESWPDRPGPDLLSFRAVDSAGQVCRGHVTY